MDEGAQHKTNYHQKACSTLAEQDPDIGIKTNNLQVVFEENKSFRIGKLIIILVKKQPAG